MAPNSILIRPSKVISIEEGLNNTIRDFFLEQNYPNPFNPSTTISFSIPKAENVKLEIYSITGELIEKIIDQKIKAGSYEYNWNSGNLPSGLYLYKLSTEFHNESKKMVLIK
jgi:hypothetical protein